MGIVDADGILALRGGGAFSTVSANGEVGSGDWPEALFPFSPSLCPTRPEFTIGSAEPVSKDAAVAAAASLRSMH